MAIHQDNHASDDEEPQINIEQSWIINDFPNQTGDVESNSIENSTGQFILKSNFQDKEQNLTIIAEVKDLKKNLNLEITLNIVNLNNPNKGETKTESFNFSPSSPSLSIEFKKPINKYTQKSGYLDSENNMTINFTFKTKEKSETPALDYQYNNYSTYNYSYAKYSYATPVDNSKELTGYVGLRNQGATCYMNSFLQSLFHLPAFRRLVYNIFTTGSEDPAKSIPLNLQRLFCEMQFSDKACSTKLLTKSFGWGDTETFTQHDVHEFARVLIDNIERKLKGSALENSIADLFRGHYKSFIRCKNVPYESSRIEEFYDLQMLVKGCPDLQASFAAYIEKDVLEGNNQYKTEEYGMQDAEMGIEFIDFPKILHIHLRRFDFDFDYLRQVKINDRFEFPQTLNLKDYLGEEEKQKNLPSTFELFGVLVHRGTVYAGHYYTFLRPTSDQQWLEFNDSSVTKVEQETAIDDNFGGKSSTGYEKQYSAYILVYVRKDAIGQVFSPVDDSSIPQHLIDWMSHEKEREEEERKQQEEEKNHVKCTIYTDQSIVENTASNERGFITKEGFKEIVLDKTIPVSELVEKVKDELKYDKIRLWNIRYYSTPTDILTSNDQTQISTISRWDGLTLFAENTDDPIPEHSIVVWVKFFFPSKESPLQFIGSFIVKENDQLQALYSQVNEAIGFPEDTPLFSYLETLSTPTLVKNDETFSENAIVTGTMLIIQQQLNQTLLEPTITFIPKKEKVNDEEEPKQKLEHIENIPIYTTNELPDPTKETFAMYYAFSLPQLEILVFNFENPENPLFYLIIPNSSSVDELKQFIIQKLGYNYDPSVNSIELFKEDEKIAGQPGLSSISSNQLCSWLFTNKEGSISKLYFSYNQDLSEAQLDKTALLKFLLQTDGYNLDRVIRFRIEKNSSIESIMRSLLEQNVISPDHKYIIAEIYLSKIYKIMADTDTIYYSYYPYLLTQLPENQLNLNEDEKVIDCAFFALSEYGYIECFDTPFFFKLIPNENFVQFKERLIKLVKMEQNDQLKYYFGESYARFDELIELKDDDIILDAYKRVGKEMKLYIYDEARNKKAKATHTNYYYSRKEKPVVINN